MKRTTATPLIGLFLVGGVVFYLLEVAAAALGIAVFVPPYTLPVSLVGVSAVVLAFSIPIWRAVRGKSAEPTNPFRAMRVAVLAKASSLAGAVLAGAGCGVIGYLLSRSVVPQAASVWMAGTAALGALLLMIAGLVSEFLCTIPPKKGDQE